MIWLRLTGCVLVTVSCGALGVLKAHQWKDHRKMLEELRRMIYLLRGEILYARSPLAEALQRAGEKSAGAPAAFFLRVAGRLAAQEGEGFYDIWQEELEDLTGTSVRQGRRLSLSRREIQELKEFGQHLGYLDVGMQERTIALYLEQLDMSIGFYREHERERVRMCTSLGIMGGLFLSVILC